MRTKKIKTRMHDRASYRHLWIVFAALVFFNTCNAAFARNEDSSKILMNGATQNYVFSGSNEKTLYPTVSAYIKSLFKEMPVGYTCVTSQSYKELKGCIGFSAPRSKDIKRIFGIFYKASDLSESGFLFIIEKHLDAYSVMESRPFQVDASAMRYGWGIENFVADSNESFHFQTTSGSASMPDSDIFRFKLVDRQWILSGHDHKTLSRCPDGSIDNGNSYSINFLTKKAIIEFRNDCKDAKIIERQLATHPIFFSSFSPSDPHLAPEAYGVAWH